MNPHIRNLIEANLTVDKMSQTPATIVMRSVFNFSTGNQAHSLYLLKQIVQRAKHHLEDKRLKNWESILPLPNEAAPSFEQLTINTYVDQLLLNAKLCYSVNPGGPIIGCEPNFNMRYAEGGSIHYTVSFNNSLEWVKFLEDVAQLSSSVITPSNSLPFDSIVTDRSTPLAQLFDFIQQELSTVPPGYHRSWIIGMLLGLPFEEAFNNTSYVRGFFNELVYQFKVADAKPHYQKADSETPPQPEWKAAHPAIQNLIGSFYGEAAKGYHTFYPNVPVRFGDTEVQSFTVIGAWCMEDFLSRLASIVSE